MTAGVGTGVTVNLAGSGSFSGQVTGITLDGEELPVIDVSHMLTTGYREKISGELIEPPKMTMQLNFEPDNPPELRLPGTCTVDFGSDTFSGSGFFISRSVEIPLEDKMTATLVWQFDGITGPAFA